ncbi:FG-GAP-like repeat-containing protein [candidate division KSB1 bacterium]
MTILFGLSAAVGPALAVTLSDSGAPLTGLRISRLAWGNYSPGVSDSLADLAVIGEEADGTRVVRIFQNQAGSLVENTGHSIPGVYFGDVAWADYDNDGDLDLAVSGLVESNTDLQMCRLYLNESGSFVLDQELDPVRYSALAFGDLNGDGWIDLISSGMDHVGKPATFVYLNIEGTYFFDDAQSVINLSRGRLAWADYDNDGDPDLVISGLDINGVRVTRFYDNHPTGFLTENKTTSDLLAAVSGGDLAWFDADSDGDLDLALSGIASGWQPVLKLYRNNPVGNLVSGGDLGSVPLSGSIRPADYDNDGDLDLAVMGNDAAGDPGLLILKNAPSGTFSDDVTQTLDPLAYGAVAWADFDNDGDLDLAAAGQDSLGAPSTTLYASDQAATLANSPPTAPADLKPATVTNKRVLFSWGPSSDTETADQSLSYILRVGTDPGGNNILSGVLPVGVGRTNAGFSVNVNLQRRLHIDTYYWSVRAVDSGFLLSPWSDEQTIVVQRFVDSDQTLAGFQASSLTAGDLDDDGLYDLILAGEDVNGVSRTAVYFNIDGSLTASRVSTLDGVENGDITLADFDLDSDLDVVITGDGFSRLYRNDGDGNFTYDLPNSAILPQTRFAMTAWGDIDNDGDLDLALGGQTGGGYHLGLYLNEPAGTLTESSSFTHPGAANGTVDLIDYDVDGDVDLVITGDRGGQTIFSNLYLNDGSGIFSVDSGNSLPGVDSSDLAWGDYDDDGDPDLLISGQGSNNLPITAIYRNEPTGTLTKLMDLEAVQGGAVDWGDYDNDGDLDLAYTGYNLSTAILRLYANNGSGSFSVDPHVITSGEGVYFSDLALFDADDDDDLDLFISGLDANLALESRAFDNIEGIDNRNSKPFEPTTLVAAPDSDRVTLSWDTGSESGGGTEATGLTYNLRVGSGPGLGDVFSGAVPYGPGIIRGNRTLELGGLQSGRYNFSVQSVDAGYLRSDWSAEMDFLIDTENPEVDRVSVNPAVTGLGRVVVIVYFEEEIGLDNSVEPAVTMTPAGGTPVAVSQLSFDANTWTGTVQILPTYNSGQAVVSVSGAADIAGNLMDAEAVAGTFRIDSQGPTVVSTSPPHEQVGVSLSARVKAVFSETMDQESITGQTLGLMLGDQKVEGRVEYNQATLSATFIPNSVLQPNKDYTAVVSATVTDSVGNTMSGDYTWDFQTANRILVAQGGTIGDMASGISIYVSPNALESDQEISVEAVPQADLKMPPAETATSLGLFYHLGPTGESLALGKPGSLTFYYAGFIIPELPETGFRIFQFNAADSSWSKIGGTVDDGMDQVRTSVSSLGTFGLFSDLTESQGIGSIGEVDIQPRVFSPRGGGFGQETTISFPLDGAGEVTIEIYNEAGRLIRILRDESSFGAGRQSVVWDGKDQDSNIVPSGIFIVVVRTDDKVKTKTVGVLNKY